jgi:hypothetical protein
VGVFVYAKVPNPEELRVPLGAGLDIANCDKRLRSNADRSRGDLLRR